MWGLGPSPRFSGGAHAVPLPSPASRALATRLLTRVRIGHWQKPKLGADALEAVTASARQQGHGYGSGSGRGRATGNSAAGTMIAGLTPASASTVEHGN